ncbi:hypothetical protein NC652_009812 [Populus alba x Populus x berolinensis]|nr:hypothetical protein NC652_009812 [Populus alba x Populus x berolinensis]
MMAARTFLLLLSISRMLTLMLNLKLPSCFLSFRAKFFSACQCFLMTPRP